MREIKFRAWDTPNKVMCDVGSINYLAGGINVDGPGHYIGNGWASCNEGFKNPIDVILMQYTGLKDAYGQEIYEGDIVKGYCHYPNKVFEVRYLASKSNCGFVATDSPDRDRLIRSWYEDITVIGNIYENPELLEQSKCLKLK
jgi:uncharacterized phage protein (TIGR01671 family)